MSRAPGGINPPPPFFSWGRSRCVVRPAPPASLAVFNHAILYVPKHKLFPDGTAEFHGSGELPGDDRGAEVLVVEPDGGSQFFRTPDAIPSDNLDETRITARLEPDGSASMQVQGSARGAWTAELRRV